MDAWTLLLEALPKAAHYAAVQLAVGIAVTHWLLRHTGGGPLLAASTPAIDRWLARLAVRSAVLVLVALSVRAVAHTAAAFGVVEIQLEALQVVTLESRWGQAWQQQMLAACLLLLAAACIRWRTAGGWALFSAAAATNCGVVPLLGHAAGSVWRELMHGIHVVASGAWIGTLAILCALCLSAKSREWVTTTGTMVSRFWVIALPSAALLSVTGVVLGIVYVQRVAHLVETPYGQSLVLKLLGVGAVAACGWRNWRRSRNLSAASVRLMAVELLFALTVILITSVLTELEHP